MTKEEYFQWIESILDPGETFEKPEALADIKVLELATLVLGPAVGSYLSELGATVFKVELPGTGDTMRSLTPFAKFYKGCALGWLKEARNKYHVAVDVRVNEGKELFLDLARRCDVLVENLSVGTMDRWGLGYRQLRGLNDRLIYIALNGFGQWGAFVQRPSYDAIAQAESGMAWITGFPGRPPLKSGIWLGDHYGALMGAVGVLAALAHRDRTGKGQYIEFSQCENLMRSMDWTWIWQNLTGKTRARYGNRDVAISPAAICRCRDGWMAVAAATNEQFSGLCHAMGKTSLLEDARFRNADVRLVEENAQLLLDIIEDWTLEHTLDEIDTLAGRYGFAAHRVSTGKDHFHDEHLIQRCFTQRVDDPVYGEIIEEGIVPKLSETPGRIKWAGKPVGFDNEYVLKRFLGLDEEKIQELERKRVIGKGSGVVPGRLPPDGWDGVSGVILGPCKASEPRGGRHDR